MTATRCPGFTFRTAPPTASTIPTISCPTMIPGTARGTPPCRICRSLAQMDERVTRTTASVGCKRTGAGRSSRINCSFRLYVTASMATPPFQLQNR